MTSHAYTENALVERATMEVLASLGWATVSARAEAGAAPEATAQALTINTRSAGWAFALGANDWSAFATPLEAIVEPK